MAANTAVITTWTHEPSDNPGFADSECEEDEDELYEAQNGSDAEDAAPATRPRAEPPASLPAVSAVTYVDARDVLREARAERARGVQRTPSTSPGDSDGDSEWSDGGGGDGGGGDSDGEDGTGRGVRDAREVVPVDVLDTMLYWADTHTRTPGATDLDKDLHGLSEMYLHLIGCVPMAVVASAVSSYFREFIAHSGRFGGVDPELTPCDVENYLEMSLRDDVQLARITEHIVDNISLCARYQWALGADGVPTSTVHATQFTKYVQSYMKVVELKLKHAAASRKPQTSRTRRSHGDTDGIASLLSKARRGAEQGSRRRQRGARTDPYPEPEPSPRTAGPITAFADFVFNVDAGERAGGRAS